MKGKVFTVDAIALAAYLAAANPSLTGLAAHEWIGIGAALVIALHCAMHFDWIRHRVASARRSRSTRGIARVVGLALAALSLVTCIVSGLAVSGAVLPSFGLYVDGYYFWTAIHSVSAKVLLALLMLHVATSIPKLAGTLKGSDDASEKPIGKDRS